MNHRREKSERNLLDNSAAQDFKTAQKVWQFTGVVLACEDDHSCQLCEHHHLKYHYQLQNTLNAKVLLVGSECILRFTAINILDETGQQLTESAKHKDHLVDARNKKTRELMLEPLRMLYRLDIENQTAIKPLAIILKIGNGISPTEMNFLFTRLCNFGIPFESWRYKVSTRTTKERGQLCDLSAGDLARIKPALSKKQLSTFPRLFL